MNRAKLGIAITAVAAVVGIAAAHPGHPSITPPTVVLEPAATGVPFELFRGNRIIVPVQINGHETEALLDTGASITTFDRAYARSIDLPAGLKIDARGAGGPVSAELVSAINIELGGLRLGGLSVGVMDLAPVARSLGRPINVVLGRDFFNASVISIDWAKNRLTFARSDAFKPNRGAVPISLKRNGPFNTIPVSINGESAIEALFDIGNGGALALPKPYWGEREALANLRFADAQVGGVGGLHSARAVVVPSVSLAGRTFTKVPAVLSDVGSNSEPTQMANVGIGLLREFHVDLDLGHDRVFLTPRADAPGFDRDRAGVRTELAGDRLKVVFVASQGPAAMAGLKVGDEIVAVDNLKVSADYYNEPEWSRAEVGRTVTLARTDGSTVKVTLADYF